MITKITNVGDPKNRRVIELIPINHGTPEGGKRYSLIGFEKDGTVWIQPHDLGIAPEDAGPVMDFPQPWLIVDAVQGLVLLHWRAAAKLLEPKIDREKWECFVNSLFQEYLHQCAYDSTRKV